MVAAVSSCPSEETILGFVDHALDAARGAALERHLGTCASCRRLVSELARELPSRAGHDTAVADAAITEAGAARPEPALPRGTTVGRYLIVSPLGRGGMGVVYRAYDPDLNRQVALKLVQLGALGEVGREQARQRLLREAQALAKLSHPNVVVVHDVGTFGDDVFVAMELVEGVTLRTWLHAQRRTTGEILRVFRAAGHGLAAAHAVGVVHRDFKPENVMVGHDGRVRVLDFGLARIAARVSQPMIDVRPRGGDDVTHAGAVVGTPAYMSPEQDAGGEVGAASDQFSFCVALYEALFDQLPHPGATYLERAHSRASGEVLAAPKRSGVTSRIRRAVLIGLRPAPGDRHPDLDALLGELAPRGWRSPRAILAIALAGLVVGIAATWLLAGRREAGPTCEVVATRAANVWNTARRVQLTASLGRAAGATPERATEIVAAVDQWVTDWTAERTAVCEASISTSTPADHAADQVQCLEAALTRLDASLTVFAGWDHPEVDRVASILGELPPSRACRTKFADMPPADEKAIAAKAIGEILRVNAALRAGKLDDALAAARRVVEATRGSQGGTALALKTLADVHAMRGELAAARATYREAALAGSAAKSDSLVVESWLSLIRVSFQDRKVDDEVRAAMFAARVAVARLAPDDPERPMLSFVEGTIYLVEGKLDASIAALEQAVATWRRLGALRFRGEIAQARNSLGLAYSYRGDWAVARAHLVASFDDMVAVYGEMQTPVAAPKRTLALVELRRDHFEDAERLAREALELTRKPAPRSQAVGESELMLASVYVLWDRCAQAVPHLAAGRAMLEDTLGKDAPALAVVQVLEARCELAKAPRAALATLTAARATAVAAPVQIDELAEIDFALAEALARTGQHARAIATAQRARAAFLAIGAGMASRVRALDRWLASASR